MSTARHLTAADYRTTPWKNGGGSTTEIAAWPPGSDLASFTWRVSVAEVAISGPFSSFPGIDRVLVQLEGDPMTLEHEGGARPLERLAPVAFPGEQATFGRLGGSVAHDFNVMTRRGRVEAGVNVLDAGAGTRWRCGGRAMARLIYVVGGTVTVSNLRLARGEAWLLAGEAAIDTGFELGTELGAQLIEVSLRPGGG